MGPVIKSGSGNTVAANVTATPHPVPLPNRWGEDGQRSGEGLAASPTAKVFLETL